MMNLGLALVVIGVLFVGGGLAQRRSTAGPDDRPRYYKALGVSLWPYEMKNLVRHGKGRVWIDFYLNGTSTTVGDEVIEKDEWIEIVLWSSVPIDNLRVFDVTNDQLLFTKSGEGVMKCGERSRGGTTTFPKRYVICAIDVPKPDARLRVEITDENVNEFEYFKDARLIEKP